MESQPLLNGSSECVSEVTMQQRYVINLDADPFIPHGCKLERHRKGGQFEFGVDKVALYLDEAQRVSKIRGTELWKKLRAKAVVFNANLLDWLLTHPDLIPVAWRGLRIFFWGTIYRRANGNLCIRCLYWGNHRWCSDYLDLADMWRAHKDPAAVLVVA